MREGASLAQAVVSRLASPELLRAGNGRRMGLAAFAVIAALYVLAQAWAGPGPVYADSYDYGRIAYTMLGQSKAEARHQATVMLCRSSAEVAQRNKELDPTQWDEPDVTLSTFEACMPKATRDVESRKPRYTAIFDSRPGYPFVASVFGVFVGVHKGLWLASIIFTVVGAGLVMLIAGRLGGTYRSLTVAGVLYLALPTGAWNVQLLSEGAALATILLVLLGNVLLVQRRFRSGILLSLLGYLAAFAVKSSEGLVFAVLALGAAVAGAVLMRRLRHLGSLALAAVSTAGLAGTAVGARLLGWPGVGESLQDTFTNHFQEPEVADPWSRLLDLNLTYWHYWLADQAVHPLLLLCVVVSVMALWRWQRELALLLVAAAMTGLVTTLSHPLFTQSERLFSPIWLAVVFGVPVTVHALMASRSPSQTPGRPVSLGALTLSGELTHGRR